MHAEALGGECAHHEGLWAKMVQARCPVLFHHTQAFQGTQQPVPGRLREVRLVDQIRQARTPPR